MWVRFPPRAQKIDIINKICYILLCCTHIDIASIAQLVEQPPLKRWVHGSNPCGRTLNIMRCAGGEMADALALGASGVIHGGSSPLPRTNC